MLSSPPRGENETPATWHKWFIGSFCKGPRPPGSGLLMRISGARSLKVSALSAHTFDNAVVTARETCGATVPPWDCGSVLVIQDSTVSIASGWGDRVTDEQCMWAQTFGPRCALKDGWKSLETPSEFVAFFKLLWNAMKVWQLAEKKMQGSRPNVSQLFLFK